MGHNVTTVGIPGLDAIMQGGLPAGSVTVLEGAPGTGKSTLAIQFLNYGAVHCGEPGIYITFEELPEQLYTDMRAFGWDLRALEKTNRLRIVCTSPEVLIGQMQEPEGLLERLLNETSCRRLVIDSVSLLRYLTRQPGDLRLTLYTLRNILRKRELTSIWIREQSGPEEAELPIEHFLADGVIRLKLKPFMDKYRIRTVEIMKLRGSKYAEGEHQFRITDAGMHIIPAFSMAEDKIVAEAGELSGTGIPGLDQLLSGGIPRGSVLLLDTNSKANYKYLVASVMASRLREGATCIIMLSAITRIDYLNRLYSLFDIQLEAEAEEGRLFFIDHYMRECPGSLEKFVVPAAGLADDDYARMMEERVWAELERDLQEGKECCVYYDLNTVCSERGMSAGMKLFADAAARCRAMGVTLLALCNFSELSKETASFLERSCNGVIRTWVDGDYQYLQVTKSPSGRITPPHIVENTDVAPYIRLI